MTINEKIKLYVFHYKPEPLVLSEPEYIHIWAGKDGGKVLEGFIGDDTGDNISAKNKYYSELTGLYWVWKNTKSDVVGSCHYRRYFTNAKEPVFYQIKRLLYYPVGIWKKRYGLTYTQNINFWKPKILAETTINDLLEEYEAILPKARKLKYSVKEHYTRYHNIEDLNRIEKILKKDYTEYLASYKTLLSTKRIFANNMFVLKWDTFEKLMEWLFSILFKFEEEIQLENYNGYQERIFGFLSERLITLWIIHNEIKYKELPLIYFKKLKPNTNA